MPNWCYNNVTVSHENPEMLKRFFDAGERGELFEEFVPTPPELLEAVANNQEHPENLRKHGYSSWYDHHVGEWGTKWDITDQSFHTLDENKETVYGSFSTAWGPPIAFYDKLVDMGFKIDAEYTEEGMCFCGTYDNENGEEYYEYDFDNENWRDGLPQSLVEQLEPSYDMYLEYKKEYDEA